MPQYEYQAGDEAGYDEGAGMDEAMGAYQDADVLGAIMRRRGQRQPARQQQQQRQYPTTQGGHRIYSAPPLPQSPFQPNVSRLRSFLGMGFATWSDTDGGDKILEVQPQESFRGERLIVDSIASSGAAGLVLVRRVDVGTMPQTPSVEAPAPAAMFQPDVTGAKLDMQIAYRATRLQVTLGVTSAPGMGETVTAAVGFYGQWIR
jgi:hypothetical protein